MTLSEAMTPAGQTCRDMQSDPAMSSVGIQGMSSGSGGLHDLLKRKAFKYKYLHPDHSGSKGGRILFYLNRGYGDWGVW